MRWTKRQQRPGKVTLKLSLNFGQTSKLLVKRATVHLLAECAKPSEAESGI